MKWPTFIPRADAPTEESVINRLVERALPEAAANQHALQAARAEAAKRQRRENWAATTALNVTVTK